MISANSIVSAVVNSIKQLQEEKTKEEIATIFHGIDAMWDEGKIVGEAVATILTRLIQEGSHISDDRRGLKTQEHEEFLDNIVKSLQE